MGLAVLLSRAQCGLEAPLVRVEADIGGGLPRFSIVGLPEKAVTEARDRVRAAIRNSGFRFPSSGRITVNLAPADLPKEGGRFDLAIALGVLHASKQIPAASFERIEFYGELSLQGQLRPFRGALPTAVQAAKAGNALVVPESNAGEAALVGDAEVLGAGTLLQVCEHVRGNERLVPASRSPACGEARYPDLADVRGQAHAKRALEIAAAGAHSMLMIGPHGTGKSMMAMRLPGLLPQMTEEEAIETAAVHSVSGRPFDPAYWRCRPFRAPHHTASGVALVGGGGLPRPGEISLAHNGVLFLDELPEFQRHVLEVLREPLESGRIVISRAARQAEYPARFLLAAAMNPCPCGHLGDARCRCTEDQVQRYRQRISGPLLDRIDIQVEVPRPPAQVLRPGHGTEENSRDVAARVEAAWHRQLARQGKPNGHLEAAELDSACRPEPAAGRLVEQAMLRFGLSARAYHRILKVARTVADLQAAERIATGHVSEAIGLRRLDRFADPG